MEWLNKLVELLAEGAPLLVRLAWGPVSPPFSAGADFREFRPQFVTILVLAIALTSSTLIVSLEPGHNSEFLRYLRYVLVCLIVLALLYMALSRIFRIHISPEQIFYVFSLLAAPWVPILVYCLRIGVKVGSESTVASFLFMVAGPPIIILLAIFNISRGIAKISGCSLWKALASMAVLAFMIVVSIYVVL